MPLERPYQFNGISLQDQSKRNYGVALPGPPLFGLSSPMAGPMLAPAPIPVYDGMVGATRASTSSPSSTSHHLRAVEFYTTGRALTPGDLTGSNGLWHADAPRRLPAAANHAAAADSTIGLTADLGLVVGRQYRGDGLTYRLNASMTSAHTPRSATHHASTPASPVINTTDALTATDWNGLHD